MNFAVLMIPITRAVVLLAAGTAACVLAACADTTGEQPPPADTAKRPPIAVSVATVSSGDLTNATEVVGSLAPKFSAEVKSEVSGTVAAVFVTQWVPVRRGTPLARLDTSETDAALDALKAAEAQARVAETRARREHERAKQLRAYGLITQQGLDEAGSALEAAEAAVKAAQAQVRTGTARLAKSSIKSPMDGIVAERNVSVGDRVENVGSSAAMFRIVDNRLLDLTLDVPSGELASVRPGQRVEFTTDAVPGQTFSGKIMFINPYVDPASRSAKVIAEVANPRGALKGGLFVRARILTLARTSVLQAPRAALLNWNVAGRTADVFIVRDGVAHRRAIRTAAGTPAGASVEVVSGLAAGDQVVVRGAFALRDGDAVAIAPVSGS